MALIGQKLPVAYDNFRVSSRSVLSHGRSLYMKKLLASALALVGISAGTQAQPTLQTFDPKSILFTTPTLSNDIAELDPVSGQPSKADLVFHEDEWAQIEFLRADQLPAIKKMLGEFKLFEIAHRAKPGWTQVYVRSLPREAVVSGNGALRHLGNVLGAAIGPAPILFSSGTVNGRVRNGASFDLGGNISLYTAPASDGVLVLGANVGPQPDDSKLMAAFAKLNASDHLLLVDWRQQIVLIAMTPDGRVDAWRP